MDAVYGDCCTRQTYDDLSDIVKKLIKVYRVAELAVFKIELEEVSALGDLKRALVSSSDQKISIGVED